MILCYPLMNLERSVVRVGVREAGRGGGQL